MSLSLPVTWRDLSVGRLRFRTAACRARRDVADRRRSAACSNPAMIAVTPVHPRTEHGYAETTAYRSSQPASHANKCAWASGPEHGPSLAGEHVAQGVYRAAELQ